MKYRVTFINKKLAHVALAANGQADPTADTIMEEQTGATLYATIEADTDAEAQEKAKRLETELRTGIPKDALPDNS